MKRTHPEPAGGALHNTWTSGFPTEEVWVLKPVLNPVLHKPGFLTVLTQVLKLVWVLGVVLVAGVDGMVLGVLRSNTSQQQEEEKGLYPFLNLVATWPVVIK